jgi:hypothetical protein
MLATNPHISQGNHYDFEFPRGTTRKIPLHFTQESEDGPPINWTGATFELRVYTDKAAAVADVAPLFKLTAGNGLLVAPAVGLVEVGFTVAQLNSLIGFIAHYRLWVQESSGDTDVVLQGSVVVT